MGQHPIEMYILKSEFVYSTAVNWHDNIGIKILENIYYNPVCHLACRITKIKKKIS